MDLIIDLIGEIGKLLSFVLSVYLFLKASSARDKDTCYTCMLYGF